MDLLEKIQYLRRRRDRYLKMIEKYEVRINDDVSLSKYEWYDFGCKRGIIHEIEDEIDDFTEEYNNATKQGRIR